MECVNSELEALNVYLLTKHEMGNSPFGVDFVCTITIEAWLCLPTTTFLHHSFCVHCKPHN